MAITENQSPSAERVGMSPLSAMCQVQSVKDVPGSFPKPITYHLVIS